ncbi:MAG: DUF2063 domain-containing protein [Thioalkalivibrionaceae bacterium]
MTAMTGDAGQPPAAASGPVRSNGRPADPQAALAAHLRDPIRNPPPEGIEDRRLAIYRRLFRNNVRSLLAGAFPVTERVLGKSAFHSLVDRFYAEHAAHTPYFHRIGEEFVTWVSDQAQALADTAPADSVGAGPVTRSAATSHAPGARWPAFLAELLHYERAELDVAFGEFSSVPAHDREGDPWQGVAVLAPSLRLPAYEFPVQRISPTFQPRQADGPPTYLMLYRDGHDKMHFVDLNPLSAALLWQLQQAPDALDSLLRSVLRDLGLNPESSELWASARVLVRQWQHSGVILGTLCADPEPAACR